MAQKKRSTVAARILGPGLVMMATIPLAVGSAPSAVARASSSDTTTVSWRGPELSPFWSVYLPRLQCPPTHPYLLDQWFNGGSGFRNQPGVEFADYRRGFDAVALSYLRIPYERGELRTGMSGVRDYVLNSATNWGTTPTGFTLILHCTSDPKKGVFDKRPQQP
jgi:hypothetical protein